MTEQPGRPKYYRGAVAISGDRIALVSDSPQRIERYERERGEGLQVADGAGRLVMPGLINLHNHVSMTLMRGYADDLPLMPWLTEKIWPFEAKLDGDDIYSGAQILRDLGVKSMRLLTNNPDKLYQLTEFGMRINSRVPIQMDANAHDLFYLRTKQKRMGHLVNY